DLVVGRARHAREQVAGRHHEPGRAEAALDGARLDERLLHRVELAVAREPLDRHDVVPVGLRREHEARADEPAVEEHRAGAALALLAGVLRAGEAEVLAQREEQALALPDVALDLLAVDAQADPHAVSLSIARRASTRSACRR